MRVESKVTHLVYDSEDVVYFKNALQSALYFNAGAKIQDILYDKKERKLIFVFLKEDHERLIVPWTNYELG